MAEAADSAGAEAAALTTLLEASDNGRLFRTVAPISAGARTIAFAPVAARVFRISILTPPPQQNQGRGELGGFGGAPGGGRAQAPAAPAGTQIAEFVLHGSVVNRFQEKAAFSAATNIYAMATPPVPAADAIRQADVIDLTSKMRADGALDWTPPAGNWVVLRFGYSLTGQQNRPASPEATGLEVDKLNKSHVKAYFDNYLDQYKDATGGLMGKRGLQVRDHGQLGSGCRQLDRRHGRRVWQAPWLRDDAMAARSRRPHRGKRGGHRPLPVGLPQDVV